MALEALRVVLSLLWVVFSLPVVTLGGATAALYDAVVHGFRRHESDYLYRFFTTFRAEWKHGILPTLLCGAVIGGLWFGCTRFTGSTSGDAAVMLAVYGCVWLTGYLLFLPLLLLPALLALFCSLFLERVFKRYEQDGE